MFYLLPWQMQVSKSDSGDSPPEDDPDSVVVEYVDFVKVIEFWFDSVNQFGELVYHK